MNLVVQIYHLYYPTVLEVRNLTWFCLTELKVLIVASWHEDGFLRRQVKWSGICIAGTPLQHSCLENPMDGGAWWAAVHGVTKSQIRLSDFTFNFHFHALEKEMATHSSVLAWRIPGTEEPGGLPSLGSHRVGHDWSDLAAAAAAYHEHKHTPTLFPKP